MPAQAAATRAASRRALAADELRETLLARVRWATAATWECPDAELDAEAAVLEAAGEYVVPSEAELSGLAPDPLAGPPEGALAWLADLPGPLLDEYVRATSEPTGPEPIKAGWWSRAAGDGGGFAAGGMADHLPPGPVLAGLTADRHATGLDRLTDDELIGMLRAARRLASWSASLELAAVGDLMRRRIGQEAAGQTGVAEHADAEIAAALTLTGRAAGGLLDLAMALQRLPLTARALTAGTIDLPRAMVIVEEMAGLGDDHAARVEAHVLARAEGQTTTKLRAATRRAVTAVDPTAARKRKERAQRDARVERWAEQAGTAALAGRDLPPAGALAADQHVSELARALQASGAAGTMDQLRAHVFVALLTGQPVTSLLLSDQAPGLPPSDGSSGSLPAGRINVTMPLGTWLGLSQSPGEVPGFGVLDADDCRSLGKAMATHPRTRWCLTITDENGHPIAHGCASRRRGPPPAGDPVPPTGRGARPTGDRAPSAEGRAPTAGDLAPPAGDGAPSGGDRASPAQDRAPPAGVPGRGAVPGWAAGIAAWVADLELQWLESGACTHRRESAGYRPPSSLQHLIRVRQQMCAFPGCGRPARRCDLDHTVPYEAGGRTCECNLAPLCRRHHQCKQTHGWTLEQPRPGIMIWTTPSGRSYTTYPAPYPG
jgi:Domain of unknown function (DUF222)